MDTQLDCVYDAESALVAAFKLKNLVNFNKALDRGAHADQIDKETETSIFEVICQTPKSGKFIQACLKAGCDLRSKNEELEKFPIHFAAESLDAENLRVLLEVDSSLVNQKYYDQTPLHIVADCFNTDNFEVAAEAFKTLLKFGADINVPTLDKELTPFAVLLKKLVRVKDERKVDLIKYIVRQCVIVDVDSYRNQEARGLLQKHFPDVEVLFPVVVASTDFEANNKEQNIMVLIQRLNSDEQKFIQALNVLKNDAKYENAINAILDEGELLHAAIEREQEGSVAELLRLGANVNRVKPGTTYTPVGVACQRGNWKILQQLMAHPSLALQNNTKEKFNFKDPLLNIVVKSLEGRKCSEVCDYYKCFDILINHPGIDVNDQDASGNTALHYAVRYKNDFAIKKLLEKSAYIGTNNIMKALPIRDIAPDVLESFFDSCITTNGERPGDDEYEIRFDYSCLVPASLRSTTNEKLGKRQNFAEELSPIQYMADTNELKYLIQHPLISSFLFLKWFRLSPIFYTNLACYSIYCVSLISYIVFCFEENSTTAKLLWTLSLLGAIYVLIREVVQFFIAPFNYLRSYENYLELGLIVLTWIVLTSSGGNDQQPTHNKHTVKQVICAITIMFAAAELSLLVGSLPFFSISTHMVMLKTVSMSFLRGLALYSIILVAFAFSFYTLFKEPPKKDGKLMSMKNETTSDEADNDDDDDQLNRFVDPGRALIKTIVMMTGEFEASSIDFNQNALSYLIFVLFLFFMSIVVLNLLNGLAVSDTQMIKSQAELNNWLERTKLLTNYEKIMLGTSNNQIQNFLIQIACMKRGSSIISMFPQFLPLNSIYINVNSNPPNQMFIPFNPITHVERGEMHPLNAKRTDSARLEPPIKALACCLRWKNCAAMDNKIVKYAKRVLLDKEKRANEECEKNRLKERIDNIEKKLNEILKVLKNL